MSTFYSQQRSIVTLIEPSQTNKQTDGQVLVLDSEGVPDNDPMTQNSLLFLADLCSSLNDLSLSQESVCR